VRCLELREQPTDQRNCPVRERDPPLSSRRAERVEPCAALTFGNSVAPALTVKPPVKVLLPLSCVVPPLSTTAVWLTPIGQVAAEVIGPPVTVRVLRVAPLLVIPSPTRDHVPRATAARTR